MTCNNKLLIKIEVHFFIRKKIRGLVLKKLLVKTIKEKDYYIYSLDPIFTPIKTQKICKLIGTYFNRWLEYAPSKYPSINIHSTY